MNNKAILSIIAAIVLVGAGWIWWHAPERGMRPAQNVMPSAATSAAVQQIATQILSPDPEDSAKGLSVAESNSETAQKIRQQIGMMLNAGLTPEGVVSHLKMIGLIPGDPGLPPGHPAIGSN